MYLWVITKYIGVYIFIFINLFAVISTHNHSVYCSVFGQVDMVPAAIYVFFLITFISVYRLLIYRGHIQHNFAQSATMAVTKFRSNFALTNNTLTGELWSAFYDLFKEKWLRYIESALYTPGQNSKIFFNELSHQDNGEYQQFVHSGMETYHFSKKLWSIVCVGALASVQCP